MTRARSGKTVLRGRKRLRKLTKGFVMSRHHLIRQSLVDNLEALRRQGRCLKRGESVTLAHVAG